MAALLSGIALTNAGLGAVHGFAAPLGANFPIPHGAVCAALLPHVIAANAAALRRAAPDHPARARYAEIGRILSKGPALGTDEAIEAAVRETALLARHLQIPPLRNFGVTGADVADMVILAKKSSSMRFNPVALSDESLAEALHGAIDNT